MIETDRNRSKPEFRTKMTDATCGTCRHFKEITGSMNCTVEPPRVFVAFDSEARFSNAVTTYPQPLADWPGCSKHVTRQMPS